MDTENGTPAKKRKSQTKEPLAYQAPKKYAYLRGSIDKVDTDNQHHQIEQFAATFGGVDEWVIETHTGNSYSEDRELGGLINRLQPGDLLFVADVSRLGRRTLDVMESGSRIIKRKARLFFIENGLELKDDIGSEVTFFGLSLGARIAREMTSAKTKAALRRKKAEGVQLGRPVGSNSAMKRLAARHKEIHDFYRVKKLSKSAIARVMEVSRNTMSEYIDQHFAKLVDTTP